MRDNVIIEVEKIWSTIYEIQAVMYARCKLLIKQVARLTSASQSGRRWSRAAAAHAALRRPFGCQLIEWATSALEVCNIGLMPRETDADECTASRGPQRPAGCSCFAGR